jgi:hypothetical protein
MPNRQKFFGSFFQKRTKTFACKVFPAPWRIAVALVLVPLAAASQAPRALVIGNSTYVGLPGLPGCAASARTVSAALRRRGFAVTEKLDVSNGEMGSAIREVAAPGATALVLYVCGYAMDYGGHAFLLPASAQIERDTDALTQGVVAKSALTAVETSNAPAALVLLDAVAAPVPPDGTAAVPHFDKLLAAPVRTGFVAAFSDAAPPQGASAFAAAIAAALGQPVLQVGDVITAIAGRTAAPGVALTQLTPSAPGYLVDAPVPPSASPPAAAAAPAEPDEAHMTDVDRRAVQSALLRLGYYDRAADGVFGPETRAAIRRYQHEIGAPMTGEITPAQSARLVSAGR